MHRMPTTPEAPNPGSTKISNATRIRPMMKSRMASTNVSPLNRELAQKTRMKQSAAVMPGTVSPGTFNSRMRPMNPTTHEDDGHRRQPQEVGEAVQPARAAPREPRSGGRRRRRTLP